MAIIVELPRLTDTMEEGVIAQWHIAEGDKVKRGQVIADIETDKATMEFESFDAGYVLKLVASEGDTLGLGAPIAVLGKKDEDVGDLLTALANRAAGGAEAEAQEPAKEDAATSTESAVPVEAEATPAAPAEAPAAQTLDNGRIPASPLARRLAREAGLELSQIEGSGPHGRIIKADVDRAVAEGVKPKSADTPKVATASSEVDEHGRPYATHEDTTVKLSQMRKTIVKRMGQSKREAPHIYLTMPIRMDEAAAARKQLNAALAEQGVKVSFNDFIIKAAAKALRVHPRVNAHYTPDGIIEYGNAHVGMAVALDDGLVVPVVRYADQKTLKAIASETRSLGTRARDRKLAPAEMSGSTFTVTNLGMFGIEEFMAVVNPGEGGILAVGAIKDEVVVEDGQMVIRKMMRVTLCSDHRVFDGADNAKFLVTLKGLLEQPMGLFV